MARPDRKSAERRGRRAEWLAAAYLRLKGYRVLEMRARTPIGEIDILARKGNLVAIIEVKQRSDREAGLNAVPETAWRRIGRAADARLSHKWQALFDCDRRFDLIIVTPGLRIFHQKDTWRPDFALTRD